MICFVEQPVRGLGNVFISILFLFFSFFRFRRTVWAEYLQGVFFNLPQCWDKFGGNSCFSFLLQFFLVQHQRGQQPESQLLGDGHRDLDQLHLYPQSQTVIGLGKKELDTLKNLLRLLQRHSELPLCAKLYWGY